MEIEDTHRIKDAVDRVEHDQEVEPIIEVLPEIRRLASVMQAVLRPGVGAAVVAALLAALGNRAGFDGWYDGIDEDVRQDIRLELALLAEVVIAEAAGIR